MLMDLLSDIPAEEKATLLEERYNIHTSREMKEAMTEMCNLSYAIEEKGREEGLKKGREEQLEKNVLSAIRNGLSKEQIMEIFAITAEKYAHYVSMQ